MIGSISHELRTPLNCIVVLIDLAIHEIEKKESKEITEKYLNPAKNTCDYLLCLISSILDFTKGSFNEKPKMTYD